MKIIYVLILIIIFPQIIFSNNYFDKEKEFQMGIGSIMTSNNLKNMIETKKRLIAIKHDYDYEMKGVNDEDQEKIESLDKNIQRGIVFSNVLKSMGYGLEFRILWRAMIVEIDFISVPYTYDFKDNESQIIFIPMLGIKAPFLLMPYFLAGPIFTFGLFNNGISEGRIWQNKKKYVENSFFRIGLNLKIGFDIKFKCFSFGCFCQYSINNIKKYFYDVSQIINSDYSKHEIVNNFFRERSYFGISFCCYINTKEKIKKEEKE